MQHERRACVAEESDPPQRQYSPKAGTRRTAPSAAALLRPAPQRFGERVSTTRVMVSPTTSMRAIRQAGPRLGGGLMRVSSACQLAARAFRCRYQKASEIVRRSLGRASGATALAGSERTRPTQPPLRVLRPIPCGIPRRHREVARTLGHAAAGAARTSGGLRNGPRPAGAAAGRRVIA